MLLSSNGWATGQDAGNQQFNSLGLISDDSGE